MGRHRLVILEMTFMKHWGTIINFVLFAFICLIICIAVWMLSGDIQIWMKLVIYAITFAILFPLIRYIKRIRVKRREVLFLVLMVCALHANAQTEQDDKGILSGNDAALQTMGFVNHLMIDSAKYDVLHRHLSVGGLFHASCGIIIHDAFLHYGFRLSGDILQ